MTNLKTTPQPCKFPRRNIAEIPVKHAFFDLAPGHLACTDGARSFEYGFVLPATCRVDDLFGLIAAQKGSSMTVTSPRHVRAGATDRVSSRLGRRACIRERSYRPGTAADTVPTLAAADAFVPSVSLATMTFDQQAPQTVLTRRGP